MGSVALESAAGVVYPRRERPGFKQTVFFFVFPSDHLVLRLESAEPAGETGKTAKPLVWSPPFSSRQIQHKEVRKMKNKQETQTDEIRELFAALHKLPQREREKFLYMAQGAALVAEAAEQTEEAG